MSRSLITMIIAYAMLFISRSIFSQTLVNVGKEEMSAITRQVQVDYLPLTRADSDGKPQLSVDPTQSFKIIKSGSSDRYAIAITYVPKLSKIEDAESQCEIAIYSAEHRFVSTIFSVGLSSYGICEGFDAIGFVHEKREVIFGIGVIVNMAYGPSAIERKTPFFIRWDKHAQKLVADTKISQKLQNTKGLDSLYGIKQALR